MAWKDGDLQAQERELLERLAREFRLGPTAVDRVLRELSGRGVEDVDPERLVEILEDVQWNSVQILEEAISGPIAEAVSDGRRPVRAIALDDVVVIALYPSGLSAHFLEGTSFVRWADIVTYSRVPTMAAAVQLHTEEGRTLSLVDSRLRGIALILDRLFGSERGSAPAPEIDKSGVIPD